MTPRPMLAHEMQSFAAELRRLYGDLYDGWAFTIEGWAATLDAARSPKVAPDEGLASEHRWDHDGEHMWWLCDVPLIAAGYGRDEELRAALLTIAGPTLVEAGHGCVTVDRMRAVARAALASPDPATPEDPR